MSDNKRAEYGEDEIISVQFDEEAPFDCGIMGVFEVGGKQYIALEALDDTDDVYLYGYKELEDDEFELLDIESQEEFDRVEQEFYKLMDQPM